MYVNGITSTYLSIDNFPYKLNNETVNSSLKTVFRQKCFADFMELISHIRVPNQPQDTELRGGVSKRISRLSCLRCQTMYASHHCFWHTEFWYYQRYAPSSFSNFTRIQRVYTTQMVQGRGGNTNCKAVIRREGQTYRARAIFKIISIFILG